MDYMTACFNDQQRSANWLSANARIQSHVNGLLLGVVDAEQLKFELDPDCVRATYELRANAVVNTVETVIIRQVYGLRHHSHLPARVESENLEFRMAPEAQLVWRLAKTPMEYDESPCRNAGLTKTQFRERYVIRGSAVQGCSAPPIGVGGRNWDFWMDTEGVVRAARLVE